MSLHGYQKVFLLAGGARECAACAGLYRSAFVVYADLGLHGIQHGTGPGATRHGCQAIMHLRDNDAAPAWPVIGTSLH